MTDLRELEKRLEALEACSEQIDAKTAEAIDRAFPFETEPDARYELISAVRGSLDAAVALVERCLPTAFPTIDRYSISDEPTAARYNWRVWIKWIEGGDTIREAFSGTKSSPALALCLALIRALIAKGDRHD